MENTIFYRIIIIIIFFLFLGSDVDVFGNPNTRKFYNVNDVYGLSLRGANSICKDQRGFVWISSKTGVLRLTEDDSKHYALPYVTPDVLSVYLVYQNSNLLAYTNNGQVFKYDHLYDEFLLLFDLRQILNNSHIVVQRVLLEEDGTFFISSSSGLHKYNEGKVHEIVGDVEQGFLDIEWYDENHIFAGKNDGVWKYNVRTFEKELLFENDFSGALQISSLLFDKKLNRLWVGTSSGGLYYYCGEENTFTNAVLPNLARQPILTMEINMDSTLFLGYDGQGLWELNREGTEILNIYRENVDDPSSLGGNGVYDVFSDSDKRVWICTYSGGVSFFEQSTPLVSQIRHQINEPNSLVNNTVNDVVEDSRDNIWFATNNGISRWEVETDNWTSFYNEESGQAIVFLSVFEDSNGNIWAGTWASGLFVLDGKSGQEISHFSRLGETGPVLYDFIFDTTQDSQGDIWIVGVVENVVRYDPATGELREYGTQPVYKIEEYSENEMLLACSYGLVLLNKISGHVETLLEGYIIHDILIQGNYIWCGTSGGGLVRFDMDEGKAEGYTMESGLPSNFINSVFYSNGYLWLGTENGVCRFNPENEGVTTYSSVIPLAQGSFNQGAGCTLNDGKLILGANDGAIMFDPDLPEPEAPEGNIYFDNIEISGKSIRDKTIFDLQTQVDSLEEISLSYNQNTITFDLVPIGISSSGSKFSWKLEGVDQTWSVPASNRILTFANLPSGEFELKIRLLNNSLSQVLDERGLSITITPPFWRTGWFYLIAVLFVVAVLYFFLRYHINLIQQLHAEDKIRFFANTAHEIRTTLTLISGPVDELSKESQLSEKGQYYLKLAKEQIGRLATVATQLLDFQKFDKGKEQLHFKTINIVNLVEQRKLMFEAYARKKNIQLLFYPGDNELFSSVDIGMMEKVIDNVISNAIKYSPDESKIVITLNAEKRNWVLKVKDQGIGISAKGRKRLFKEFYRSENAVNSEIVGSGIGLLMVKKYVEKHGGIISVESQENKGSTFTIEIPFYHKGIVPDEQNIERIKTGQASDFEPAPLPDLKPAKDRGMDVLVVEDNEKLRNFLELSLSEGFNVLSVSNGKEAWELIKKKLPDIVVSDVMMPEMDGFELCRFIKSTYETSHIPVVLLTALSEKAEQLHGMGLGADAYLTKPFDISLLVGRIKSIISNRKVIREKALKLIDENNSAPLMENELNDKFVKKAVEVAKLKIADPKFGKNEFAAEMNVSSSLLYKKIKNLTNQSPTDFIKSVRLNHALELLQSGKFTVTEVSEKVGFSSVGYFSTVFKKFYGKSPTEVLDVTE